MSEFKIHCPTIYQLEGVNACWIVPPVAVENPRKGEMGDGENRGPSDGSIAPVEIRTANRWPKAPRDGESSIVGYAMGPHGETGRAITLGDLRGRNREP